MAMNSRRHDTSCRRFLVIQKFPDFACRFIIHDGQIADGLLIIDFIQDVSSIIRIHMGKAYRLRKKDSFQPTGFHNPLHLFLYSQKKVRHFFRWQICVNDGSEFIWQACIKLSLIIRMHFLRNSVRNWSRFSVLSACKQKLVIHFDLLSRSPLPVSSSPPQPYTLLKQIFHFFVYILFFK